MCKRTNVCSKFMSTVSPSNGETMKMLQIVSTLRGQLLDKRRGDYNMQIKYTFIQKTSNCNVTHGEISRNICFFKTTFNDKI